MYLHNLVDCLIQECHLNNGLNVYTRASKLPLRVDGKNYTLLSNREGRNVDGIVWILQEALVHITHVHVCIFPESNPIRYALLMLR